MKQKIEIDTLRGFACILLVLLHVVGNTPGAGLTLPADHRLQGFNRWLAFVQIPLFAFISGFVCACRPLQCDTRLFHPRQGNASAASDGHHRHGVRRCCRHWSRSPIGRPNRGT